jgi:hypothetical protein
MPRNSGTFSSPMNAFNLTHCHLDYFLPGCPCGYHGDPRRACTGAAGAVSRYRPADKGTAFILTASGIVDRANCSGSRSPRLTLPKSLTLMIENSNISVTMEQSAHGEEQRDRRCDAPATTYNGLVLIPAGGDTWQMRTLVRRVLPVLAIRLPSPRRGLFASPRCFWRSTPASTSVGT